MMKTPRILLAAIALLAAGVSRAGSTADPAFDAQLLSIQQAWARVNYDTPAGDARAEAFDALEKRAEAFTKQHPGRAEALIWEGIIESSYAGAKGGLGALGLAKEARGNLEAALKINPTALDGSAYTSLGTLTLVHFVPFVFKTELKRTNSPICGYNKPHGRTRSYPNCTKWRPGFIQHPDPALSGHGLQHGAPHPRRR